MWFDRLAVWRQDTWILRIGKCAAQLWRTGVSPWQMVASASLNQGKTPLESMAQALDALAKQGGAQLRKARINVILESAWAPVIKIDLGPELWSSDHARAWLRHRAIQVFGRRGQSPDGWILLTDHRPGDRFGIGFAMDVEVRSQVLRTLKQHDLVPRSIKPAWAWAWGVWPARKHAVPGWSVLVEQDRTLTLYSSGGQTALHETELLAMETAGVVPQNADEWSKQLEQHKLRFGVVDAGSAGCREGQPGDKPVGVWAWPGELRGFESSAADAALDRPRVMRWAEVAQ